VRRWTLLIVPRLLLYSWAAAQETLPVLHGRWTATVGPSQVLRGQWYTRFSADSPNDATGSWTLLNQEGQRVMQGTWSARKSARDRSAFGRHKPWMGDPAPAHGGRSFLTSPARHFETCWNRLRSRRSQVPGEAARTRGIGGSRGLRRKPAEDSTEARSPAVFWGPKARVSMLPFNHLHRHEKAMSAPPT